MGLTIKSRRLGAPRAGQVAIVLALSGTGSVASVHAQDGNLEIVVTGERQERSTFATSSSVVAVGADDLEGRSGADRLDQILNAIPNVQVGSGGEGPTIRGQDTTGVLRDAPAFFGGAKPRVTLQIDGRPISYNELAFGITGLWDVARVEVFRSPQTTTQGRNSIAGAIFVETQDPTLDWSGRARLVFADYATRQFSAALSGPLIADQLALRVAGDIRTGQPTSNLTSAATGIDPNRDEYSLLRIKALATPAFIPGLRLLGTFSRNRSNGPQVDGIRPPYEERRDPAATYGYFETSVDSLTLRAEMPLSGTLSAKATLSQGITESRRFAPPGFGEASTRIRDLGAEASLTWTPSSRIGFTGGINLFENRLDQTINLTAAALGRSSFADLQRSLGLFGEIRWSPRSRWEVTAGARYQRDSQVRTGLIVTPLVERPVAFDRVFARILPKVSVSYAPTDQIRLGFLVQRAYNPGGTTINLASFAPDTFDPEELWSYELFARAKLARGLLQLSANLYHYDMRDAQRSVTYALDTPGGIVTYAEIGNAPRAWARGLELQAWWKVTPRLSLDLSFGLQQTRLTETPSPADPLLGKEFQRAPHFTGFASMDWRPFDSLRVTAQMRHNAGYFSDDTNDPARRVGSATSVDARAEFSWRQFAIAAYARNLLDAFYLTYRYAGPSQLATAGEPRRFGVELTARF